MFNPADPNLPGNSAEDDLTNLRMRGENCGEKRHMKLLGGENGG